MSEDSEKAAKHPGEPGGALGGDGLKGGIAAEAGPLPHGDGGVQGEHHLEGDGGEVQQLPGQGGKEHQGQREGGCHQRKVYPGDFQFQQEASHRRRLQKESFQKGRQAHSTPPAQEERGVCQHTSPRQPGPLRVYPQQAGQIPGGEQAEGHALRRAHRGGVPPKEQGRRRVKQADVHHAGQRHRRQAGKPTGGKGAQRQGLA